MCIAVDQSFFGARHAISCDLQPPSFTLLFPAAVNLSL